MRLPCQFPLPLPLLLPVLRPAKGGVRGVVQGRRTEAGRVFLTSVNVGPPCYMSRFCPPNPDHTSPPGPGHAPQRESEAQLRAGRAGVQTDGFCRRRLTSQKYGRRGGRSLRGGRCPGIVDGNSRSRKRSCRKRASFIGRRINKSYQTGRCESRHTFRGESRLRAAPQTCPKRCGAGCPRA